MLFDFAWQLASMQHRAGRYFVLEQPSRAKSWGLPSAQQLLQLDGVDFVSCDMCRFGVAAMDEQGEGLSLKPTRILTNSPAIQQKPNLKCQGGHRHVVLLSGKAAGAHVYPMALCKAMLGAIALQKRIGHAGLSQVMAVETVDPLDDQQDGLDGIDVSSDEQAGYYIDDTTGPRLNSAG